MKLKFTLIDYIIIILIIIAVVFAFIHITSDNSSDMQKTAFDESTTNKIPDTYLKYYKDGFIVNATVEGFNSTNGERVTINGNVVWLNYDNGADTRLLIHTDSGEYLTGLYRYNPNADIYIDHISLESNGEKYKNLVEIKTKPKEITSLNDLVSGISDDADFEITTRISTDLIDSIKVQKLTNKLQDSKRVSIKTATSNMDNQLIITKATKENINDASSILGDIDGLTEQITIRIYNCSDTDIDSVKKNYDITNIRKF